MFRLKKILDIMTSCTSPDDTGRSLIWCESVRAGSQRLHQLSSADSHSWVMLFVKLHQTWRDGEQSRISLREATLLSVCCWIWCRPTDGFKLKQSWIEMLRHSGLHRRYPRSHNTVWIAYSIWLSELKHDTWTSCKAERQFKTFLF